MNSIVADASEVPLFASWKRRSTTSENWIRKVGTNRVLRDYSSEQCFPIHEPTVLPSHLKFPGQHPHKLRKQETPRPIETGHSDIVPGFASRRPSTSTTCYSSTNSIVAAGCGVLLFASWMRRSITSGA